MPAEDGRVATEATSLRHLDWKGPAHCDQPQRLLALRAASKQEKGCHATPAQSEVNPRSAKCSHAHKLQAGLLEGTPVLKPTGQALGRDPDCITFLGMELAAHQEDPKPKPSPSPSPALTSPKTGLTSVDRHWDLGCLLTGSTGCRGGEGPG
ncbi:hypothetical protein AAY473_004116 [Plecturocebus cupreus]